MDTKEMCGFAFWRPKWFQAYATSRNFMIFYGILGTFQSMTLLYSTMTLTTLERRFKIPSYISGFVFSGSEVSQILLSLILSYMGGQHNRPRWIAWGGGLSAMACLVMGGSHVYFGPGDDAIHLTEEYIHQNDMNLSLIERKTNFDLEHKLCQTEQPKECLSNDQQTTVLPLVLIFCTRFVIGIGFTLYITLGTPYLDDGIARKNSPIMLATAFTFKVLGSLAFILVNASLRMYVDPWSTPVIAQDDPRWIGAWWFGYVVLGIGMAIVSIFIGIFPEQLPSLSKNNDKQNKSIVEEEMVSLQNAIQNENKSDENDLIPDSFFVALNRLIKNKLVVFKLTAEIFYVLAGTGILVYYSKFMEVMFNKSPADASIVTGPMELVLTISSYYLAAGFIGKYRPSYRTLMLSSIFVSFLVFNGFFINLLLPCDTTSVVNQLGSYNLSTTCNQHCFCDDIAFSPVCDNTLKTTFFSPCHAGCTSWNQLNREFSGCSCAIPQNTNSPINSPSLESSTKNYALTQGVCFSDCTTQFLTYVVIFSVINAIGGGVNIGRSLIDMRVVENRDKSFSSGLTVWAISIFATIPGRILYGYIIDSTCVIWNNKCQQRGHCQMYDQALFRLYINGLAMLFTLIGSCFEGLAWFFDKNTPLYEDRAL